MSKALTSVPPDRRIDAPPLLDETKFSPLQRLNSVDGPARFHQAMLAGKAALPPAKALGVNIRTPAELAAFSDLHLSDDEKTMGGVIDSELRGLMSFGQRGAGMAAAKQIIDETSAYRACLIGAEKLPIFAQAGLHPMATYEWDQQKNPPKDWPPQAEKPDIFMLGYDPAGRWAGQDVKRVGGYDEAVAVVDDRLSGHGHRRSAENTGLDPKTGVRKQRVFVVGAGIIGLMIAKALNDRGVEVTLFEKGASVANPESASGDRNRIFREAYKKPGMARMAQRSLALWKQLEKDLGGHYFEQRGTMLLSLAKGDRIDQFRKGLDDAGQQYDMPDPDQVVKELPFLSREKLNYVISQPHDGGLLLPEKIGADLRDHLLNSGVEIRTGTEIVDYHASSRKGGVVLTTKEKERFVADKAVFAVGPWTAEQFPGMAEKLGIKAYHTAVAYLKAPPDLQAAWERAPCFMVGGEPRSERSKETDPSPGYVLPPIKDGAGLKIGQAFIKERSSKLDEDKKFTEEAGRRLLLGFSSLFARSDEYEVLETKTCPISFADGERLSSMTLKEIGEGLPNRHADGIALSTDSGHCYKLAPAIAEIVAEAIGTNQEAAINPRLAGDA